MKMWKNGRRPSSMASTAGDAHFLRLCAIIEPSSYVRVDRDEYLRQSFREDRAIDWKPDQPPRKENHPRA
jgi:hypothetical protein